MVGDEEPFDVMVVGAGPAGLGIGVALKHAGISNFQILDRGRPAQSFAEWPSGMQLITPSFPANSIGVLDLNSIAIGTSPGYSLGAEHPFGKDFAAYLQGLSRFFELPTRSNTEVVDVYKDSEDFFVLITLEGELRCRHLVWATGEFQFPNIPSWTGASIGIHNSRIGNWSDYITAGQGPAVIIGGYESGVDAAHQLSVLNCSSLLLARETTWESDDSDPSRSLSPFTLQRFLKARGSGLMEPIGGVDVQAIERTNGTYSVIAADGRVWTTERHPILATGFQGGFRQIVDRFELREDGYPLLNEVDESTLTPNLFLVGPSVRHEDLIFCFIYKFRQRFGVVAKAIAERLGLETDEFEKSYRRWGMFLDDFECCGEQCVC
jgi:putative flavoprotein involved in K+ transport